MVLNISPEIFKEGIVNYFYRIYDDAQYNLLQGTLSKGKDYFVITGRYCGNDYMNKPEFLFGHPIDIIGQYYLKYDIFSTDRNGSKTHNLYDSRILFSASDIGFNEEIKERSFHHNCCPDKNLKFSVEMCFENGVLKPKYVEIKPKVIEENGLLVELKTADGFQRVASKSLNLKPEQLKGLIAHLF